MATRKHFTDLAELAGHIASGRIPLAEVIEEFAATLDESSEPGFKRDKFVVHANTQREHEGIPVRELKVGEPFTVDGLLLRADKVEHRESGDVWITTVSDTAIDTSTDSVGHRLMFEFDSDTVV